MSRIHKDQISIQKKTDLHTHTIASDGILSPRELVDKSTEYGLSFLAITDHDCLDGYSQARDYALEKRLDLISGVEISCSEGGREIHMLAYYVDPANEALGTLLSKIRNSRIVRTEKILEKLSTLNIKVSLNDVKEFAKGNIIARPHIASAIQSKGYVETTNDAFINYIGNDKPAYVAIDECRVEDVIRTVKASCGVAILAHPARMVRMSKIVEYIAYGLDGIEVYHPSHTKQWVNYLRNFSKRYDLIATGGSDFHGTNPWDYSNFGSYSVDVEVIESMKKLSRQRALQT
jgi:predicted metal-dependent phosphoesterase TrpH